MGNRIKEQRKVENPETKIGQDKGGEKMEFSMLADVRNLLSKQGHNTLPKETKEKFNELASILEKVGEEKAALAYIQDVEEMTGELLHFYTIVRETSKLIHRLPKKSHWSLAYILTQALTNL